MASIVFEGPQRFSARARISFRVAAVGLAVAVGLFCVPTLLTLHDPWSNSYYSDGYPVAVLAVILVINEWRRGPLPQDPSVLGLLALLATSGMTLAGHAADILIVPQFLLPVLLLSTIWTVGGTVGLKRFAPSLLFLYFAIPFWRDVEQFLVGFPDFNEQLRRLSTFMVSAAVRAVSIPAFIDQNLIHLPSGTFEIAEGCSGRVYLTAAVELALFFGLIELNRWRSRLILVSVAGALSLAANWLRIFVLVMVGYYTEMQSSLVDDHANFGWLLFLVVIAPIIVIVRKLARHEEEHGFFGLRPASPSTSRGSAVVPVLAFVMLAAGCWGLYRTETIPHDAAGEPAAIALPEIGGWDVVAGWDGTDRPVFESVDAEAAGSYRRGVDVVRVYLAEYAAQWQGHEIVYNLNRPEGNEAKIVAARSVTVEDKDGRSFPFVELEVAGGESTRLVWYGMRVSGRPTASQSIAKALQAFGALHSRTDAQALVISTGCAGHCDAARFVLSGFTREAASALYGSADNSGKHSSESRKP